MESRFSQLPRTGWTQWICLLYVLFRKVYVWIFRATQQQVGSLIPDTDFSAKEPTIHSSCDNEGCCIPKENTIDAVFLTGLLGNSESGLKWMKLLALDPCLCETPDRVLGADETLGVLGEVHIQHWQAVSWAWPSLSRHLSERWPDCGALQGLEQHPHQQYGSTNREPWPTSQASGSSPLRCRSPPESHPGACRHREVLREGNGKWCCMHTPLLMMMSSWWMPEIASAWDICHSGCRHVLPEVNCCREGWAGWVGKRTEKTPKIWILGSFCCQGSFHYGNKCWSSLFAISGNGLYTASARRVEITLGYEELGSNLYPRGPEYRFSESRWSALSMGSSV